MAYLTGRHHEELCASGLTLETIRESGIWSAVPEQVQLILGAKDWGPGMVFPYRGLQGEQNHHKVVKLDNAEHERRYQSPGGAGNRLYVPFGLDLAVVSDPGRELLITEGQKKCMKATQDGFPCVGLSGVWGWKTRERPGDPTSPSNPIDDFDRVAWRERKVFLIFDSDIVWKLPVRKALDALAEELMRRGAIVYEVRLPNGPPGVDGTPTKMGLDDYLVANSPMDLARLMERAQECLPVVEVRNGRWGDAYDAVHEAMVLRNYLKRGPRVFVRSGVLVTTVRTQEDMPLAVQTLDETKLAGFLARNVVLRTCNAKGEPRDTTKFPAEVCRDLLNRRSYRGLPRLRGIVEVPVLSAEGHINVTPGYQEDTQLYYVPAPGFVVPSVPEHPTASEVSAAHGLLEEVIHDFPFDGAASKANALALLLLPFVREVIPGPTPLHLVDASTEGSGKTLLVNTVHRIATGRPAALGTWPTQEEEVRKRVTASLMRGSRWMIFDNVSGSLTSETLASVLTSISWSDRVLGSSQQVEVANLACWAATANNLTLSRELTDRTLWIRLEPGEENPRHRSGFLHDPLEDWLDKERGRLVWACLVLARVWWQKGKPSGGMLLDKTMGSFQGWFNVMGGVLAVAGIEGLLENREQQEEEVDADLGPWRHFYSLWATRSGMAEAPTRMLVDLATEAGLPLPERGVPEVSLGRLLKSRLGRVIGTYTLRRRMLNGVHLWRLEKK